MILMMMLVLTVLLLPNAWAADKPLPPAAEWISKDAVVVLEVSEPKAVLDLVLHPGVIEAVTSSPAYKKQASNAEFRQFQNLIKHLERRFGVDWKTAVSKLVGGGAALALGPKDASLLIVDAKDAKMLQELHEVFRFIAKGEAEKQGEPDRVASSEYRGVTVWTFGPNEAHAIIGHRLLLTNRPETLKAVLDRRAQPGGPSLVKAAAYQRAHKAAGADAAARLYVNTAVMKQLPPIKKALVGNQNPLAVLLLAGVTETLRESNWLAMGLDVRGDTLVLQTATDGAIQGATGAATFTLPRHAGKGAMPNVAVPRQIATVSVYRDLHGFYAAKDELFPERTSGLIFFENMMGIFFTGRDLTEEVLAETGPDVRLVVAEQKYDPKVGTPRVQIPSFAVVFRLKNPKKFSPVVEEAWQKAVGLINFTRGQQALAGLILDRPTHGDTKYTVAYFSASGEDVKTAVDTHFNFRPSLAMPGHYLVLSSTDTLAENLIDALSKETADAVKPLSGTHSLVEIDGTQLASILAANRENMVRQNMVDEGNTRAQAETAIDILLTVVKRVKGVTLNVGNHAGQSRATLQLQLNLPSGEKGDE